MAENLIPADNTLILIQPVDPVCIWLEEVPPGDQTMSYVTYIHRRLRYSGLTRLLLEVFAKLGIEIRIFLLHREGRFDHTLDALIDGLEGYKTTFLDADGMAPIAALSDLPGRSIPDKDLQKRLQGGNKCLAVTKDGEIVSFTWCDLASCTFHGYPFPLKDNEAYLFDSYTFLPFRGKGLAPFIRYLLYVELAGMGRDTCYSISDRFNLSSLRFKEKLRAQKLLLGVYVVLFSRWRFFVTLKKYDNLFPQRS